MKILLILGGEAPTRQQAEAGFAWADRVLCTDSGADALAAWGMKPDLLVGDMDSIDPAALAAMEAQGVEIRRHDPHKDLTDGQLACILALEMGAREVRVLGGWGGRADHSFANLMLLRFLAERGVAARMRCPGQWVQVFGPGRYGVPGPLDGTFSLLPLADGAAVRIEGAEYPLEKETPMPLSPAPELPIGLSNVKTGPEAAFTVERGWMLGFFPAG